MTISIPLQDYSDKMLRDCWATQVETIKGRSTNIYMLWLIPTARAIKKAVEHEMDSRRINWNIMKTKLA